MYKFLLAILMLLLAQFAPAAQAGPDVRVIISGEVAPGIYGRVDYGNDRPPPIEPFGENPAETEAPGLSVAAVQAAVARSAPDER